MIYFSVEVSDPEEPTRYFIKPEEVQSYIDRLEEDIIPYVSRYEVIGPISTKKLVQILNGTRFAKSVKDVTNKFPRAE